MEGFRKNGRLYLLAALFAINFFVWAVLFSGERETLTIAFLDVGQGDATFIESPSGRQMLIDGGAGRAVLRELGKVMPFYDRSIDVVLATHPDKDHIGGLPDVLERYRIDYFLDPGASADTGTYAQLYRLIDTLDIKNLLARRGMIVDLGGGAYMKILFPDRDVSEIESNAASVIAQLVYGDTEIMLTGDSPSSIEKFIAGLDGKGLESDVLKVGHHGSRTSSSEFFVGFVSPLYAVISAGADNRYGHPHREVLDTLSTFGANVLGTYEKGRVIFESDGETVRLR